MILPYVYNIWRFLTENRYIWLNKLLNDRNISQNIPNVAHILQSQVLDLH